MKNSLILLMALLIVLFTSCSKNDKIELETKIVLNKRNIVGTWNVDSIATSGSFKELLNGNIYFAIHDNNTYKVNFFDSIYSGKYILNENTMIGKISDPITEYFKFEGLGQKRTVISYINSEGHKYKFVVKQEKLTLDYDVKKVTNLTTVDWYQTKVYFVKYPSGEINGYKMVGTVKAGDFCTVITNEPYFYITAYDINGRLIMCDRIFPFLSDKGKIMSGQLYII